MPRKRGQASDLAEMLTSPGTRAGARGRRRRGSGRQEAAAQAGWNARRGAPTGHRRTRHQPHRPLPQAAAVTGAARVQPVAGRVLHGSGDQTEGGAARGQTIIAPAGARVVSPCAGRVFSGPFRSYGLLLIVDCATGHHVVLAGLGRLDTATGARLLAGEPVGVVGDGRAAGVGST